jgi:predicted ATPase
MIQRVLLKNFKAFTEINLEISKFTLLAGMNGVGKSSVIQSLLLLRQSYKSGDLQRGSLQLNGFLVEIGTARDLLFLDASDDEIGICIKFSDNDNDIELNFKINTDTIDYYLQAGDKFLYNPLLWHATLFRVEGGSKNFLTGDGHNFQYLCAERSGPRKFTAMSDSNISEFEVGKHGEYAQHFLSRYGAELRLDPECFRFIKGSAELLIDQVDGWLQEISPGAHLDLEEVRSADLMISRFAFDRSKDVRTRPFRATNVGFGLSYALPILIALLSAKSGALVIIENPEAHLHPQGQTRMGQLCARAAADGVQVILETHSDHVLDGARISVRHGILSPEDVCFHYFERKDGLVQVTSPVLDREGRVSEWPRGFFDQHRINTAALIRPVGR